MHKYNFIETIMFPPIHLDAKKLRNAIQGKTIFITGASSGIGEQLAISLCELQIKLTLVLVARRGEKLAALKQSIESELVEVHIVCADLRVQEELKVVLDLLHRLPNGVDIVVNNAGLSINRPVLQSLVRFHDFTRTMAINYFAPVQLILGVMPMLERNRGHIINISTINVLLAPVPNWAAYQASKGAFDTWLQSATPELQRIGVSTSSLYLPLVRTPMILPTKAYTNAPAMTTEHVAKIILHSMYAKKRRYKPWWLLFGELASILFKKVIDKTFTGRR